MRKSPIVGFYVHNKYKVFKGIYLTCRSYYTLLNHPNSYLLRRTEFGVTFVVISTNLRRMCYKTGYIISRQNYKGKKFPSPETHNILLPHRLFFSVFEI